MQIPPLYVLSVDRRYGAGLIERWVQRGGAGIIFLLFGAFFLYRIWLGLQLASKSWASD
jgi:hypothetical protein